jgi:acetyl esterase/lipase
VTPAQEERALLALPPAVPDRSRRYGPHPSQVVDYYGWPGEGTALTVLHGGFWRERHDRSHLSATAAALAGEGFAVALVEYRRVGGGGGWPGTFDDVRRAVPLAWGGAPAVLLGHSAGGHLALWAARRVPEAVARVVAAGPVADLGFAARLRLSGGAVDELLGAEGELAVTDPARMLPAPRPEVIVHGTGDPDVPVEVSRRYAAAAGAELRELAGVGHFGPLVPGLPAYGELLAALKGRAV